MVRLTDRPDMTLDVYRGRTCKTTTQRQQRKNNCRVPEYTVTSYMVRNHTCYIEIRNIEFDISYLSLNIEFDVSYLPIELPIFEAAVYSVGWLFWA